jgi:hypothetical protein
MGVLKYPKLKAILDDSNYRAYFKDKKKYVMVATAFLNPVNYVKDAGIEGPLDQNHIDDFLSDKQYGPLFKGIAAGSKFEKIVHGINFESILN